MNKKNIYILLAVLLFIAGCGLKEPGELTSVSTSEEEVTISDTEMVSYNDYFGIEVSVDRNTQDVSENEEPFEVDSEENPDVSANEYYVEPRYNSDHTNLSVPTYIEYYDGLYFIVDCYNNQILFSDSLDKEIFDWQIMDRSTLNKPHTIAFDGEVYMVDDTDNNRIIAYVKKTNYDGTVYFERIQKFADMGERPHYIKYIPEKKAFYAWSSMSGQMWVFKRSKDATKVFLDACYTIPDLKDVYVRSFLIVDNQFYFVSGIYGDCSIYAADMDTLAVTRKIPVAPEYGGMVQITKIQDYYYISVSTSLYGETELKNFIRVDSLENITSENCESLYSYVTSGFSGTPYNLTEIDGRYYLTIHRDGWGSGVVSFDVQNNTLCDLKDYFY